MALTKRLVKGSKLTGAEHDANMDWLNSGGTSTSSTIYLNRASGWSHRATGINPLTGTLTIDLTGVVEKGWAEVFWTSSDGSWPTVTVTNGTGLGVAGANITAITKTIGTLPSAGNYNIGFDYSNGVLSMWCADASGTSSGSTDTTPPTVSSFTIANANPDLATIVFSEAVTFPDVTGLSMDGDFADITLSNPQGSGTTWTLDISRAAVNGEVGNFVYGATNTIKDTASTPNSLAAGSIGVINQVNASSNILFSDLFTGTTIDTSTKWVLANPSSGSGLAITQNDALIFTAGTSTTTPGNDYLTSIPTNDGEACLIFDLNLQHQDSTYGYWEISVRTNTAGNTFRIYRPSTSAQNVTFEVRSGGSIVKTAQVALDCSTTKRIKMYHLAGVTSLYYWNGSGWTLIDTYTGAIASPNGMYAYLTCASNGSSNVMTVDNFYYTTADVATQYPS